MLPYPVSGGSTIEGESGIDASEVDAGKDAQPEHDGGWRSPALCQHTVYSSDAARQTLTSTVLQTVAVDGVQDLLFGASGAGESILVAHACGGDGSVWMYEGALDGDYTGSALTEGLNGIDFREGRFSFAPDGLSVVGVLEGAPAFAV